jgi:hypothetical protein
MLKYLGNTRHIYLAQPEFYNRHQVRSLVISGVVSIIVGVATSVIYDKKVMFPDYAKTFLND